MKSRVAVTLCWLPAFLVSVMAWAADTLPSDYNPTGTGLAMSGGKVVMGTPIRPSTVVASLPTCNSAARGQMYIVTGALLPASLATVANGGAVVIGVTCNGAAWIVQ